MIIAARIKQLLDAHRIVQRMLSHERVATLNQAAQILTLDCNKVLTAQVLADKQGMLLVVYPLTTKIDNNKLNALLQRNLKVLAELSVNRIFIDCEAGCWPPVGQPYGLDMIIDQNIKNLDEVFFSAGSFTSMLRMSAADYFFINPRAKFLDFTRLVTALPDRNVLAPKFENRLHFPEFSHVVLTSHNAAEHTRDFWIHAFYAAAYAQRITKLVAAEHGLDPQLSYMVGLYHNFGLLLLSQMFQPEYNLLQKWMKQDPNASIEDLEHRLLGMGQAFDVVKSGHAHLGASLLQHWGMPDSLCEITREHHSKNYQGVYSAYVTIIQVTNQLLREQGIGDGALTAVSEQQLAAIGLELHVVQQAVADILLDNDELLRMAQALTK